MDKVQKYNSLNIKWFFSVQGVLALIRSLNFGNNQIKIGGYKVSFII
jgi:hypothetical protein